MKRTIALIMVVVMLLLTFTACGGDTESEVATKPPDSKEVFSNSVDSVVEIVAQSSKGENIGTGFFIDEIGTVVTNYHVIKGCSSAYISISDGGKYDVLSVAGYSKELDIAILNTQKKVTVPLPIRLESVITGEKVYTIGSSLGLTSSFSDGMISAEDREINGIKYIQTTAPISHGNSGGPLLDEYGKVIGITSAGFEEGQNLNLAIPVSYLNDINTDSPITLEKLYALEAPYQNLCKILRENGDTNEWGQYGDYSNSVIENLNGKTIWKTFEIYDTSKVIDISLYGEYGSGNRCYVYISITEDLTCKISAFGITNNLYFNMFSENCTLNEEMLHNLQVEYHKDGSSEVYKASLNNSCYTYCSSGISTLCKLFDCWLSENTEHLSVSDFGIDKDIFNK